MWSRAPWLKQRWMLLSLAVIDSLLTIGAYNLLFWHRFGVLAGITPSVALLTVIWLGVSYLVGRYSSPESGQRDSQRQRLLATAIVALVVLSTVVVVLSWGLRVRDPRTFRSFLLPLLTILTIGSALGQPLITRRLR